MENMSLEGLRNSTVKPATILCVFVWMGLPRGCSGKEYACQSRRHKRCGFDPWVEKIHWRWEWKPTPVILPGEFHGQRSLADYSSWSLKELDMTEQLSLHVGTENLQ